MKIGIVGTGILGRLVALRFAQQQHAVTLFDRDTKEGLLSCSMTAAGILAPYVEIETSPLIISQLGIDSIARWPEIISSLKQPVYFKKNGLIVLAHAQDKQEFKKYQAQIASKAISKDIISPLNQTELAKLEPELIPQFQQAIHNLQSAHISTPDALAALKTTLIELNIDWLSETVVTQLAPHTIKTENQTYQFDCVIDCRGLGAKKDLSDLRGVRGELIWLHATEVNLTHPVLLLHARYPIYIVPRSDHQYIVGASNIESEDMSSISVQTTLELLSSAFSIHSGFAEARMIHTSVNCRPAFSDNKPKIFYQEGLMRINGLYRYGYSLSPVLADEVYTLLTQSETQMKFPELLTRIKS